MNLICWNCRGLRALRTVQEVAKLVTRFNLLVLFLSETKVKSSKMEWLRSKWGYDSCLIVEAVGRSGGLALLWKQEVTVEVQSFSSNHIDARIDNTTNGDEWRFTGFYGNPIVS